MNKSMLFTDGHQEHQCVLCRADSSGHMHALVQSWTLRLYFIRHIRIVSQNRTVSHDLPRHPLLFLSHRDFYGCSRGKREFRKDLTH